MTTTEMESAYPKLCRKCEDLQSDLDATRDCVKRLKAEIEKRDSERLEYEQTIMSLKAKLYDLTSANWL